MAGLATCSILWCLVLCSLGFIPMAVTDIHSLHIISPCRSYKPARCPFLSIYYHPVGSALRTRAH